jgi:hypothetical protein
MRALPETNATQACAQSTHSPFHPANPLAASHPAESKHESEEQYGTSDQAVLQRLPRRRRRDAVQGSDTDDQESDPPLDGSGGLIRHGALLQPGLNPFRGAPGYWEVKLIERAPTFVPITATKRKKNFALTFSLSDSHARFELRYTPAKPAPAAANQRSSMLLNPRPLNIPFIVWRALVSAVLSMPSSKAAA